jgi:phytoene synthase
LLAWADTRDRFGIAQCVAEELIAGVASDLSTTRYGTLPELERYCYAVASTVGLMSAQIIGYADSYPNAPVTAQPYAIKLGLAMQLTNILRDIGEDARAGRIYLPQELLIRAGYSERELLAGQITPAWVTLMAELIAYTRQLYTESIPGIALLAAEGRFSVLAAARIYEAILGQIVANGYDVFTRRAQLSRNQKLRLLPQIWLECRRLRPPQP